MASGTVQIVAQVGGASINQTITKTGDHPNPYEGVVLPAGKTTNTWVMTNATVAACNITNGHGYSTGKHDLFWTTSGAAKCKYDVDVTISTDAATMANGTGDAYPANGVTDVIITVPVQINTAIDGDAVEILALDASTVASAYFEDADGDAIGQFDLASKEPYLWLKSSGVTNPLTGDPVTVCYASNGTATAGTITILSLEDSTP